MKAQIACKVHQRHVKRLHQWVGRGRQTSPTRQEKPRATSPWAAGVNCSRKNWPRAGGLQSGAQKSASMPYRRISGHKNGRTFWCAKSTVGSLRPGGNRMRLTYTVMTDWTAPYVQERRQKPEQLGANGFHASHELLVIHFVPSHLAESLQKTVA